MTNTPRPDSAPKGDERPQAKGEKSPFEKLRDFVRRVVNGPKSDRPEGKTPKRRGPP